MMMQSGPVGPRWKPWSHYGLVAAVEAVQANYVKRGKAKPSVETAIEQKIQEQPDFDKYTGMKPSTLGVTVSKTKRQMKQQRKARSSPSLAKIGSPACGSMTMSAVVECDVCRAKVTLPPGHWDDWRDDLVSKGWSTQYLNGANHHACPQCRGEIRRRIMSKRTNARKMAGVTK